MLVGVGLSAPAVADGYDGSLDLAGANDTYIASPTGDLLSYPGYLTTAESLYLAPLGDTGPYTPLDLPTNSYDYNTSVPQGETQVVDTVLSDYDAGKLSAAHPDVLFGYSDSASMISGAESTLYADGVPTQDVDIVLVGDTSNPVVGIIADLLDSPSIEPYAADFGLQNLVGLTTPDSYYNTDITTITGDFYADYAAMNPDGQYIHEEYMGLDAAQINAATEATEGLTHSFTVATPDLWTTLMDAFTNVFG